MSCSAAGWRGRAGSWMPDDAVRRGTVAEPRTPHERGVWRRETVRPRRGVAATAHLASEAMAGQPIFPVPRGRHAPPLEVRLSVQRHRLLAAASAVFAREGYAAASAEAISREAGMSKATFYEHFANKEECILTLFDEAARQVQLEDERGDVAGLLVAQQVADAAELETAHGELEAGAQLA